MSFCYARCVGRSSFLRCAHSRALATVGTTTYIGKAPKVPTPADAPLPSLHSTSSKVNNLVLTGLQSSNASLPSLIKQFETHSGEVLDDSLSYEPTPPIPRRVRFDAEGNDCGVFMIAHALQTPKEHKVTLCSGFALNSTRNEGSGEDEGVTIVTCAHTFEGARHSSILSKAQTTGTSSTYSSSLKSGSFVLSGRPASTILHPISSVKSALPRADLLLLACASPESARLRTLPVSPYPVHPGTRIRMHCVVERRPEGEAGEGWRPWVVEGMWSKWLKGTVLRYRDYAGREAKPGTYDALNHLLFEPLPTPGSSGGPIVDEESGAVVGMMLGTRMDNRVEGMRGWGVPAETIFEMFSLPGLKLKKR